MKKILPLLLLLAACPLFSQNKKAVIARQQKEILRLQASLDSLQMLVESLQKSSYSEDSAVLASQRGNEAMPGGMAEDNFSPDLIDSLMREWYRQRRIVMPEYNLDTLRLTSNLPDSELERRLVAMNSFITLPFNQTVKNYMILYSEKMSGSMPYLLGKAKYYFPLFEEVMTRYGLPLELKYMSVIESGLNPVARSRAGAMGIWQFMYGTAIGYGLKINSFVDERLDVEKAADAAARYLRDAYRVFGDWNLAICSYNCGAANVQKAIRRSGSNKFWDIYDYLPRETRSYVPAFVGAMYGFKYHREYGIEPASVGMPAICDTFEIRQNLHFKQISETVGVPMNVLKSLNPQYLHDIIPGSEGTYILRLPYNWSSAFMSVPRDTLYNHKSDQLLNAQVLKNIKESGLERRVAYRVKSGDILGRIAIRNGVTVSQLKKWNHLRSDTIRPGQILYIYKKN
jgi:membrane-bound lytic murein transglycosylase D